MFRIKNNPFIELSHIFFRKKGNYLHNLIPYKQYKYIFLDKSRRALPLIYMAKQKQLGRKPIILMPSYICNDFTKEIELIGAKIIYYINEVDSGESHKELKNIKFDIFLYVNYFGNLTFINKKVCNLIEQQQAWLIEDSTHSTYIDQKNNKADFILYSPYKIFGTLNGGLVLIKNKYKKEYKYIINKINLLKKSYNLYPIKTVLNYLFWLLKNLISNLGIFIKLPDFRFKNIEYKKIDNLISYKLSWKIIKTEAKKLEYIIQKRIENKKSWDQITQITIPFLKSNRNNSAPYFSTYSYKPTKNNIRYLKLYRRFGIPFSNWPDLPSTISKNKKYNYVLQKKNSIVLLPNHQSLNKKEIFFKTIAAYNKIISYRKRLVFFKYTDSEILCLIKKSQKKLFKINLYKINKDINFLNLIKINSIHRNSFIFNSFLLLNVIKKINNNTFFNNSLILLPTNEILDYDYKNKFNLENYKEDIFLNINDLYSILELYKTTRKKYNYILNEGYLIINLNIKNKPKKIEVIFLEKENKDIHLIDIKGDLQFLVLNNLLQFIINLFKQRGFNSLSINNILFRKILRNMNQDQLFIIEPYIIKK